MNHARTTSRPAFTLVELLVVIGLIAVLSTFLIVGLSTGFGAAKRASTESLVQSIGQGVEAFYNDFNFHPPVVMGQASGGITTPQMQGDYATAMRETRAHSDWTLAIYLLGAGDINADGEITEADDGASGLGIRDPGRRTRAWREANDTSADHAPPTSGRIYGEYLEPGAVERYLEPVRVSATATSITPNDTSDVILYRINDPFGVPVRYYNNWRFRDDEGEVDIRLAPIELRSAESVADQIGQGDSNFDSSADRHITASPYAILSAGDRADRYTDDTGEFIDPFGDLIAEPGTSNRVVLPYRYDAPITKSDMPDSYNDIIVELLESNVRFAQ